MVREKRKNRGAVAGIFGMAIALLSAYSCDNRLDDIASLNSDPVITILANDSTYTEFTDSVRISTDGTRIFYNLTVQMDDVDDNLKNCVINLDSARVLGYSNGQLVDFPTLRVDQRTVPVSLLPTRTGLSTVTFILRDKFDASAEARLNLFVFENLPPVAIATYSIRSGLEVEIDASQSYDLDHRYGGTIKGYEFTINGNTFITPQPTVRHIFPQRGAYTVGLRVLDNNDAYSERIELRIEI